MNAEWSRRIDDEIARLRNRPPPPPENQLFWLYVIGNHTLNASPSIVGIKASGAGAWSDPGALDPGACDPVTGAQTVAPTGSFTSSLGLGYGNLRNGFGPWRRVLVRNQTAVNGGLYPYDVRSGMVFIAAPLFDPAEICGGQPAQFWRLMSP